MKDPQKIEAICNNLADAKDEIRRAIDTLIENGDVLTQPDEMVLSLAAIRYELQQVLDKAYEMQTEAEQ